MPFCPARPRLAHLPRRQALLDPLGQQRGVRPAGRVHALDAHLVRVRPAPAPAQHPRRRCRRGACLAQRVMLGNAALAHHGCPATSQPAGGSVCSRLAGAPSGCALAPACALAAAAEMQAQAATFWAARPLGPADHSGGHAAHHEAHAADVAKEGEAGLQLAQPVHQVAAHLAG
jgi:hypothetical protein